MKNIDKFSTIIRNGYKSGLSTVNVLNSKSIINILNILKYSGYIYGFENIDSKTMKVFLKYNNNKPAISKINQLSSSKKKVYIHIKDLNPHNLNLYILSTSMGIISHYDAIKFNVGGELLLKID